MDHIKKMVKKWKLAVIWFPAVAAVGLFLRVYNLNLIPVFADEAIYVRWAQVMRAEPSLRFLPLSDGKQPLFMWIVMPALKFISDPLIAGRLVSVAVGMGTLLGVFVLSQMLFKSKKVSLLASAFYAISPFAIFFDRMALVDSMLSFFGIWLFIFAVLSIKHARADYAMLGGFAFGAALITKSPAIFFAALLPLLLIFTPNGSKSKKLKINLLRSTFYLIIIFVIGYVIYNILRLGPNFQMINSRNGDYIYPLSHVFENPTDPLLGNLTTALGWLQSMAPSAILFLALGAVFVNFLKFKRANLLLLAWIAFPLVVQSEYARVFTARYILFVIPPLAILSASIIQRLKKSPYLYMVYAFIALVVFQSALFLFPFFSNPATASWPEREGYLANWTAGTGIKKVAEIIKAKRDANPDKQIIVGTEGYFGTLPDGLQIYLNHEPNIVVLGVGIDLFEIPDSLKESVKAGNITYLVANASRLKFPGEYSDFGLVEVASFPKATRDQGSHSYIQDGPQDTLYLFEVTDDAVK